MTLLRPLIVAAVLATLALPGSAGAANEFAGIVANDVYSGSASYRAKQFAAQEAAGVGIIRQTLDWASVEVAPDSYDFTNFDHFVSEAAAHHIRVLPILFDPPPFRSSRPKRHAAKGTYFPKVPSDMGVFAAAV